MSKTAEPKTTEQGNAVYELRKLTDRWVQPLGEEVVSTHHSEEAALAAYDDQPKIAVDGTGRSGAGSFVPLVVVRVAADGRESVPVRRTGGGRW